MILGGGLTQAQTFTAGVTGDLDGVDVPLRNNVAPVSDATTIAIYAVDTNTGFPTGGPLGSGTVPGASLTPTYTSFPVAISPVVPVVSGTKYAIVLTTTAPAIGDVFWDAFGNNPYAGGGAYQAYLANSSEIVGYDAVFATHVKVPAPTGPVVTGVVAQIKGDPVVGKTLEASKLKPTPKKATISYQWFADGTPIPGAIKKSYKVSSAVLGLPITLQVTGTAPGFGETIVTSEPTANVRPAKASIIGVSSAARGETFTIDGVGFTPFESFRVELDGKALISGVADQNGQISIDVTIPLTAKTGLRKITIDRKSSDIKGKITITP